ncbi:hypothetical protein KAFR_0E02170 [Kazachstania africana CBS 2517]|uniref:PEX18/PEX21 C-terminal domain-containing protein n=1 Tax=Kazachstania africana (strain ATCC 22294 / BCRC 22015 / CBS 2517 / CECT 1963 / NBRC 1671 / NRRL Y-8276) TaxID=1071382 RepID=H2AVH0_KAZAF|nr:hypothetical protein KAFR_0E02170 [Kazachstania africana CBS 2517]CCF58370.1 hypothetical protein KAFR_0E02170 [Kazachstania africana CBS 2517]
MNASSECNVNPVKNFVDKSNDSGTVFRQRSHSQTAREHYVENEFLRPTESSISRFQLPEPPLKLSMNNAGPAPNNWIGEFSQIKLNDSTNSNKTNLHVDVPIRSSRWDKISLNNSMREPENSYRWYGVNRNNSLNVIPRQIESISFGDVEIDFTSVEEDIKQEEVQSSGNTLETLDDEQEELQNAATDIYGMAVENKANEKLLNSKFMNLMQKISDGSVTINKSKKELLSLSNGEIVGKKYIYISDRK